MQAGKVGLSLILRVQKWGNSLTEGRATAVLTVILTILIMKKTNVITNLFALLMVLCFTINTSYAQKVVDKECCMMKDGKMMHMKDGKTMTMDKDMKLKNGRMCKKTGEYTNADGKTVWLKNGQCIDMDGNVSDCAVLMKDKK